ncbi:MAG: hypothetical protein QXP81_01070 [Nitrososphaerota archaeon]
MRSVFEPPRLKFIIAQFGTCKLCGKNLTGKRVLYLKEIRSVVCSRCQRDAFAVLREYDDGYHRSLEVVDVFRWKEDAEKKAHELNERLVKMRHLTGWSYKSYTVMRLSELVTMKPSSTELEEE